MGGGLDDCVRDIITPHCSRNPLGDTASLPVRPHVHKASLRKCNAVGSSSRTSELLFEPACGGSRPADGTHHTRAFPLRPGSDSTSLTHALAAVYGNAHFDLVRHLDARRIRNALGNHLRHRFDRRDLDFTGARLWPAFHDRDRVRLGLRTHFTNGNLIRLHLLARVPAR